MHLWHSLLHPWAGLHGKGSWNVGNILEFCRIQKQYETTTQDSCWFILDLSEATRHWNRKGSDLGGFLDGAIIHKAEATAFAISVWTVRHGLKWDETTPKKLNLPRWFPPGGSCVAPFLWKKMAISMLTSHPLIQTYDDHESWTSHDLYEQSKRNWLKGRLLYNFKSLWRLHSQAITIHVDVSNDLRHHLQDSAPGHWNLAELWLPAPDQRARKGSANSGRSRPLAAPWHTNLSIQKFNCKAVKIDLSNIAKFIVSAKLLITDLSKLQLARHKQIWACSLAKKGKESGTVERMSHFRLFSKSL